MRPREIDELRTLLGEERPDLLVTEVRRLGFQVDLELPEGAGLPQALALAEAFVDSPEFEQLDEGIKSAWRWVLGKMVKAAKATVKVGAAAIVLPAIAGPAVLYKAAKWGINKAIQKLKEPKGGTGELLRGDEPFTVGDISFRPMNQNRWHAVLPGRYEFIVKYRPRHNDFSCDLEGRPVGGFWEEDALPYALQTALAYIESDEN